MPNDNHGFVNEINNYELIRGLIRQLFLYGDLENKELVESKKYGSNSNLSYHLRQIGNYLKDDRLTKSAIQADGVKKKPIRIMYDPISYPINNLAETYQEHVFKVNDISFYFTLLQMFKFEDEKEQKSENPKGNGIINNDILMSTDIPFTLPELIENFFEALKEKREYLYKKGQLRCESKDLDSRPFSEETFRRFFNKLRSDSGIFIDVEPIEDYTKDEKKDEEKDSLKASKKKAGAHSKNESNEYFYQLSNDIFSDYQSDYDVLNSLLDMIRFFYNNSDIAVPGWQLANTLYSYMCINGLADFEYTEDPIFQFSDTNALSVIDNDVFWTIISEISHRNAISFEYAIGPVKKPEVFPIRIVCERQYGRQYLFAYNYQDEQYYIYRIDRISKVEALKYKDEKKYGFLFTETTDNFSDNEVISRLNEAFDTAFKNVWNIDIRGYQNPQEVLIHFKGTEVKITSLLKIVQERNKRWKIENRTSTGFDYRITVPNTIEIIPWIRSFGKNATVDKNTNPELFDKMKTTLTEMLGRYESI